MKNCCGNRCTNQFEGPGCLCPGCRKRNEPKLRPVPKIEEVFEDKHLPKIEVLDTKE